MESGGRLLDKEFVLPLLFGTVAFNLGKKATPDASHRWTVFLRHPEDQDLSHIVQTVFYVVFRLHESFKTPLREVASQPFELTEHGWGEFDIAATIYFVPAAGEQPVEIMHKLRLFTDADAGNPGRQDPRVPVVAERYEELVFSQPQGAFYEAIMAHQPRPAPFLTIGAYLRPPDFTQYQELLASLTRQNTQLLSALHSQAAGMLA